MAQQGRKGRFHITPGLNFEHLQLNRTDPGTEVEGERSSVKVPHPFFTDLQVRQAFALAVDRAPSPSNSTGSGQPTSNFHSPEPF